MPATIDCRCLLLFLAAAACPAGDYVNAQLPFHGAVLDPQGKLLAWYQPEKNLGYDKVLRLAWDFIEHKVPADTGGTGLKIYLINSTYDGQTLQGKNWQHNPASLYGQFVDALLVWYPYSGDTEAITVVRGMLDYQLAHGTTPANWEWPGVPFATSCGNQAEYGRCLKGMPQEFYGGIETDKVGELGIGYALFYELTGERKYLDAAVRCADALAKYVRPGDARHTPWPFRLNAQTGAVLMDEEFGGMIVSPVRLLDELIRLKAGDTAAFQKARDTAWKWLPQYPLGRAGPARDRWSGYFEDIGHDPDNVNQAAPTMTAYYLMAREDPDRVDPRWMMHAGHLIDWVRQRLGRGPFLGAWGIDEQVRAEGSGCCARSGLGSDTSRWAAINALYYEKTGDLQAREDAFRSLNYATYFALSDGRISCCGEGYRNPFWFDDGYADYARNFQWAMGAVPDFAPAGQSHILRSSSVIQKVGYSARRVTYRTFDAEATEVLRLNFQPARVSNGGSLLGRRADLKAPGYTLRTLGTDCIVRIRHAGSGEISVEAP